VSYFTFDMPGCTIEMLEPVSIIKTRTSPIRTEIEGVPCSNATETAGLVTAFTVATRREELSSFMPFLPFPELFYSLLEFYLVVFGVFLPGEPKRLERSVCFFLPRCREMSCSLFSLEGHSLAKCPIYSHA